MANNDQETFYWHDYETWGANPLVDRPAQFAGLRTDLNLEPIGRPLILYVQPTPDFLPNPEAALITGITPQLALKQGVSEAAFSQAIANEFQQPNTTIIGYNNIRFDDEVTRLLFYRNFYDPYEHGWKNNNARWDLIDVVRACFALRPDGIQWPENADGQPSMKLEDLSTANGIEHGQAHDAMSDVYATIGLAKLIQEKQPKLWQWAYSIRRKQKLLSLFNWQAPEPLAHVSGFYGATQRYLSAVFPLGFHPKQNNNVVAWDLRIAPMDFADKSVEELIELTYTRRDELEHQGLTKSGLQNIHLGRCPFLAPIKTISDSAASSAALDTSGVMANAQWLRDNSDFRDKLMQVFEHTKAFAPRQDVDHQIYDGFFSPQDKKHMDIIRAAEPQQLAGLDLTFDDPRMESLLLRYRARNYPATLTDKELNQWRQFCQTRLMEPPEGMLSAEDFALKLEALANQHQEDSHKLRLLKSLYDYASSL